jgi:predicted ATPase/transcriptional regulator with XRE-family HTH domain
MPTFGELLRQFRTRAGLSQSDLAEKARISEAAVGALERGDRKAPYPSTVALLVKGLGLSSQEAAALESARAAVRYKSRESVVRNNIQAERSSFVGREGDVTKILELLGSSRLVTVTGSGGIGKTRAALEAARQILGNPWDEVWFVDLAPLVDGDYISAKIAAAIRPPLTDRAETIASLAPAIAQRQMLLILDNCEHLVARAAEAADVILGACPRVSILATSRERLNVAGEFVYRLPPLADDPAADLFLQRAQAADQRRSFDAAQMPTVVDIAQRLGGIPLSLELIAAQVHALGLETLRRRLHQEFRVPSGRRDLPARQQTVEASIRWSYRLLTADERAMLAGVSIFSGGFTLDAAESVCSWKFLSRSEILPLLLSLANKSLINVENTSCGVRYSLLESVRSFGIERLREAGTYDGAAQSHARWLAAIAEDVETTSAYLSAERASELLPELDNIRAAVAWSLGAEREGDRLYSAQILTSLSGLWDRVGGRGEHRRLIETALERIDERRYPVTVSDLLRERIACAWQEPTTLDLIDHGLSVSEKSGDPQTLIKMLLTASEALTLHRVLEKAETCIERASALSIANGLDRSMLHVHVLFARSQLRRQQGRIDDARRDVDAAGRIALAHGERSYVVCYLYVNRADIEYEAGNKRLALEYVERMMESEFASDAQVAAFALSRLANLRLQLGDVESAVEPLRAWSKLLHENEDPTRADLEYAALALALLRNPIAAARLLGCVRAREERAPFSRYKMRQDAYEMLWSSLRQQLDDGAIAAAAAEGAPLTGDEAVAEALAVLGSTQPAL